MRTLAALSSIVVSLLVGCTKPTTVNQAAQRGALETQLPASVKARLQPKIAWGACWATWRFGRTPTLSTPHQGGEPLIPIEFPTRVVVDNESDGSPDLVVRYQYDARGNITSQEIDEGADGLLDQRVVLTRDDNGAITRARREDLFPFARSDDQAFSFNPYGYLVATDDFYKKRTFAGNQVSPVVVSADGRTVKLGALAFTRDAAGEVVEARNATLDRTQTFSPADGLTTTRARTSVGNRATTFDREGRMVEDTMTWDGGQHGRRTTYRYMDAAVEIEQSELPAGACAVRWSVMRDARGELVSATRDDRCDGTVDRNVQSTVDAAGRLTSARYQDRSVTLTYQGDLVHSARFTHGPTYDETIGYEYDAAGRLVKQQRPKETSRWQYDAHGRVTSASTESMDGAGNPVSRTIRYEYGAPPLDLTGAPRCGGDRSVAGLVMASELELPALDERPPVLFEDDMALNLPSLHALSSPGGFASAALREREAAIRRALDKAQWTAVRYELVDAGRAEGTPAGPVAKRGEHQCAGSQPYFARDQRGEYFELQIEKRCKRVSTSPSVDPLACHWGTPPPEYDVVLHVPPGTTAAQPRKLVIELASCVNYTGQRPPVP